MRKKGLKMQPLAVVLTKETYHRENLMLILMIHYLVQMGVNIMKDIILRFPHLAEYIFKQLNKKIPVYLFLFTGHRRGFTGG